MRCYLVDCNGRERNIGPLTRAVRIGMPLLVLTLGLLGSQLAHADTLKPFTASYVWIWHGMTVAASTVELQEHEARWIYRSRSEPRGIGRMFAERPTQESIVELGNGAIRPLSYQADDGTPATKRDVNLAYDWDHGRVTGVYEDTKVDMPLRPGVQDDLSVQIALMVELLAGRNPDAFLLIDRNSVREYRYAREGEATLSTPVGNIETIVFRSQKAGSPRETRFWCAPSRGFIPLRVEQKRGDSIEWSMQIRSLRRD